jgi:hypothetical protein
MNMLSCFDFLSTVSGGGYVGGWLAAWIFRTKGGIKQVEKFLDPSLSPDHSEVRPITFLREYSNYLTPGLGLLGVDTWTMISIWIRNSFLNLLILASAGAALLLTPILLFGIFDVQAHAAHELGRNDPALFSSPGLVALNLKWFGEKPQTVFTSAKMDSAAHTLTFVSAFALSSIFWHYVRLGSDTIRICALVGLSIFYGSGTPPAIRAAFSLASGQTTRPLLRSPRQSQCARPSAPRSTSATRPVLPTPARNT